MPLLVMKFGGTSVADLARIKNAAAKVKREVERGYDVIVIVSAMSGKTNELVGWVEQSWADVEPGALRWHEPMVRVDASDDDGASWAPAAERCTA